MNTEHRENDLFGTLKSLQSKIGLSALANKLRELDLLHGDQDEEVVKQKVIDEVCAVVGIEKAYLLNNSLHSRDEKKQSSINFVCCILKDNLDFDLNKIKVIFGIHESNVSRRICFIRHLDRSNKVDQQIAKVYDTIVENLKKKKVIKK